LVDGTRSALIVASDQYADPGLRRLQAPASDARALAEVLRNPNIGGFEVRTLLNEPSHAVNRAVEEFFADRRPGDLLLLHFSCHGIKNLDGELYFATPDTELSVLAATAVAAEFVNRRMTRSQARRVVLLLDCCYAGAFERSLVNRSGRELGIEHYFGGRGRAVITASRAMEYAFEAGPAALQPRHLTDTHEVQPSVFTRALVEGLDTGEADRDQDGFVGLDELYEYVYDKVRAVTPNQTPGKWTFGMEGGLYIARRSHPVTTPAALPPELQQAMESPLAGIRGGAVQELTGILRGRHAGLALAARLALERLTGDDSRAVAAAATAAIGIHGPGPPQPRPAELALSATVIDLGRLPQHGQSPERRVRIGNSGVGDLNARASTSASWLKLRQIGDELVIAADSSTAGDFGGTVTLDSDGGTGIIRVHVRVDPVALPATEAASATQPEPVPETPATTRPGPQQDPALATASSATANASPLVTETADAPASPAAPADVEMMPSVDRRPTQRLRLPARTMRIGRAPDNDLVLADDLEASPNHAELRRSPTGLYEIVDLGSRNGTFVNGKRVSQAALTEHDIVSVGRSTFRLAEGELRQFVDEGEVSLTAQDLVVRAPGDKVLLDHVSFPVPEKCLLGVIGSSGSGKSTLLEALTGMRPADTGTVVYDNRDLYQNYAELRHRIGVVPRENLLNTQLPVRRALQYSAGLRFPADTKPSERDARVDEVLSELGLTKHANTRADRLSGGQLKRANVAQGLLTNPSLLFLDEPTAGLDPGLDKSVMEQMRDLAHDGRTVIVLTHSVDNLDQCDRLLVLVPGGRVAFYGPPDEGLAYFGQARWAEVFQAFERYPDRDWAAEFAASPAYARYMTGPRWRPAYRPGDQQQPPPDPPRRVGPLRQMTTLTGRNVRVMAADRGYLTFVGLLPVVLGLLIYFVGSAQGLAGPPHTNQNAQVVLLILVISACLAGAASSVRELVKERSIYIRERAAGLSSGAYLSSKLLVLGVISIAQSAILVLIGLAGQKMPPKGALPGVPPLVEILIAIAVLVLASMCLGLLVSALVSTSERAMPFLVLLTMIQVILSGGVVSLVGKPGLEQLAYLAPSRWGFGAVASTVNLNAIGVVAPGSTDPLWAQTPENWLRDMGMLIGLAVIFILLAWIRLPRLGPGRRR
jgi:ABC-type multidrug transport system ATPase subunit